ncbi:hypothetical protein COV12_01035 [Candidatus Woesearchaeota archaeon CG10_big_fil_rev_8_21_14_0_10_32_24]|nr:MAG: hypothetical protein COV12_01035 [Candidatus Woesearchaeota archaeon CG10_big_fil_rev_8_21_14_0_10_32_24]
MVYTPIGCVHPHLQTPGTEKDESQTYLPTNAFVTELRPHLRQMWVPKKYSQEEANANYESVPTLQDNDSIQCNPFAYLPSSPFTVTYPQEFYGIVKNKKPSMRLDPSGTKWNYRGPLEKRQKAMTRYIDPRTSLDPCKKKWQLNEARYNLISEENINIKPLELRTGLFDPSHYKWIDVPKDPGYEEIIEAEEVLLKPEDYMRAEGATIHILVKRYCAATALDQFGMNPTEMKAILGIDIERIIGQERPKMLQDARKNSLDALASRYSVKPKELREVYKIPQRP